jgi:hypothetical protein
MRWGEIFSISTHSWLTLPPSKECRSISVDVGGLIYLSVKIRSTAAAKAPITMREKIYQSNPSGDF